MLVSANDEIIYHVPLSGQPDPVVLAHRR
jgi:hypothetical protein